MSTKKQNVEFFNQINGWMNTIGPDGRYNRDRIFQELGVAPAADGTYSGKWGLNDKQRKQVQALVERDLGFQFPKGIEIDPAGNMNEDEGAVKQLKKYGIPAAQIGLGVLTGGMSLPASMAINAGAGAGFGALKGGGLRGILTGAGLGAASAYGGNVLRGLGKGATEGAGRSVLDASALEGLGGTGRSVLDASALEGLGATAGAKGMGLGSTLLGFGKSLGKDLLKNPKDLISGIGSALGAGSQAAASNRGTALDAALEQERIRQQQMRDYTDASRAAFDTGITRGREVRDAEGDAWRKLQQAAYVGNAPGGFALNLSPYSKAIAGPTSVERGSANTLRDEMVNRMKSLGGQYALPAAMAAPEKQSPYTIPDSLLKPGMWEKISGYAGAGLKGLAGLPVYGGKVNG